ncbi:hypothetical protein [Nannocystis radixulma]|uniref:DUF11 domain-containing protein n=1 Tax=Nannocystis radixulma TaxID=2995305 RepID=A0ABT5BC03_9BACT|nr:hypothetical protein [Nannocystis radixulma]MDC0671069.1 hypothetical protein [Nannocystis radixulma]
MAILAGIGTLVAARPALAAATGDTEVPAPCMQEVFTDATGGGKLVCTANDIRISRAISVSPTTCTEGVDFDLTATFEVDVTASSRYDAAFFFNVEGGANARGDGSNDECSASAITAPPPPNPPALNLDGDTCGDLNSGVAQVTFTIPGVECEPVSATDRRVRLPNCTSWHNSAGEECDLGDPFTYNPETKSKCNCDDNFAIPVIVQPASIVVVKTATPTQFVEPGGLATYTVEIRNTSQTATVNVATITDDVYGNLLNAANANVTQNTCPSLAGDPIGPNSSLSCTFKAQVTGQPGFTLTDVVTGCVSQPNVPNPICATDDATVTITDAPPVTPTLLKTALSTANCRMQVDATYEVKVTNQSAVDAQTVTAFNDDKFGNISTIHGPSPGVEEVLSTNCTVPRQIPAGVGQFTTCSFVGRIIQNSCDFTHTDTVTGTVRDDDGVISNPSDSADVTVSTNP